MLEKALGPGHLRVADSLNMMSGIYQVQGRYPEAEPLLDRALEIREKVLGPEHPDVANTLNNLGTLYNSQGDPAKAEMFYH